MVDPFFASAIYADGGAGALSLGSTICPTAVLATARAFSRLT